MSSVAQRVVIVGLEATPGDGATPDVALRAKMALRAMPEKIQVDEDIGSYAPARHYIGSLKAEGELTMDAAYYEGAPYPVSMALGAPSTAGAADPWTHTFALPNATTAAFRTYRAEYSDGNNHIVRADDTFAKALEISGEAKKAWVIKATLTGGSTTFPAALGASLSPIAAPTDILMADTVLKIDTTWANIGTTTVGVLISFNWKLEELQHEKFFAGSLYPTGRGNNKWKVTLELIVEIDNATVEAEKDKLLTGALSAIRIEAIDAGNADDSAQINGMYYLSEVDTLDDRDGNNIVKMIYIGQRDTLGNTGAVVIETNLAAL